MGKKIALIVVAVVAITGLVLAAVYLTKNPEFGVSSSAEEPSQTDKPANPILLGSDQEGDPQSTKIEIIGEHGSYFATRADDSLTITGLPAEELTGLESLFRSADYLTATQDLGTDGKLADYGLDTPRATANITYNDGSHATLQLGNEAPSGQGVYVQKEGDPSVYVISASTGQNFLRSKLEYVIPLIIPGTVETATFDKVVLGGSYHPQEIVIEVLPEEEMLSASGIMLNSHVITSPIQGNLDYQKGNDVISTVFGLTALRVEALVTEVDLADYGLDEPFVTFAMDGHLITEEVPGGVKLSFALQLSAPNPENEIYLIREGSPYIFVVDAATVPWLQVNTFDMISKTILMPFINDLSVITVQSPTETNTFTLDLEVTEKDDGTTKEDLHVAVNGTETETDNFRKYYQTLIATKYDTDIDEDYTLDMATAKELLTITYKYVDGRTNTLHFYEADARKTLVSLNEGDPKYIQSQHLDRIFADTKKIVAGEEIQSLL